MKKIYDNPVTDIMLIESQHILAGTFQLNDEGGTGNPSEEGAESDGLSRRRTTVWDDEEEE